MTDKAYCVTYISKKGSVQKDYIKSLSPEAAKKRVTESGKAKEILSVLLHLT
ncbi:MAG: hypothetical protein GY951_15690 [Psychromonas sp.]|nr:hypothetical protein [Psychromonas sp.]